MSGERNGEVEEELTPVPEIVRDEKAFAELSTPHALESLHKGQLYIYSQVSKLRRQLTKWQATSELRIAAIVAQTSEQTAEHIKDKIMLELVGHANRVKSTEERVSHLEAREEEQDQTIDKVRDSKTVIITQQAAAEKKDSESPPSMMPSALKPYWKNKTLRNWILFGVLVLGAVGYGVKTYVEAVAALRP